MRSNDSRGWLVVGTWLGIALVAGACTKAPGDDDDGDTSGSGGSQQAPVGSGGAGPAAAAATGGAPAVVNTGSGGGSVVAVATGGAPATEGSGGVAAGTGGATEEVPDAGMMPPPAREDLGMGDGKDVVTIGDSWMNILTNGGGIEGGLDRAGTNYRHYAVAGTTLAGSIPGQYDQAKGNTEIKTVIMTGGGNDVMFTGGCNTKEACEQAVLQIVANLNTLWTKMADDGVKDVFYIQYSKNVGTAPSDTRPDKPPPPPEICLSGKITCHTVMTTDLVGPSDSIDGIHPTRAACDLIAARVLEDMEAAGARR